MQSIRLDARLAIYLATALLVLATGPVAAQDNPSQRKAMSHGGARIWAGGNRLAQSGEAPSPSLSGNIAAHDKQVKYSAVQIGLLPSKTNSVLVNAKSINNLGHATGTSWVDNGDLSNEFRTGQAFIWKNGKLKALPLLNGWMGAFGYAINDRDQVVGLAGNVDSDDSVSYTAVLWSNGQPVNVGTLFPGSNSFAQGVNNWGVAVGGSALPDNSGNNAPFVWHGGSLHALPFLPGMNHGLAESINDFGIIVGRQGPPDDSSQVPCLWYWNGTGYTPVSLGGFGGDYGDATGNNNLGQAAGWSLYAGDLHGPAFLWDFRGLQALPQLPGDTDGQGSQINDLGEITGWSQLYDAQGNFVSQRVVIWQNGQVTELQSVIPPDTPMLTGIGNANILGQISVSSGSTSGTTVSYILTPK